MYEGLLLIVTVAKDENGFIKIALVIAQKPVTETDTAFFERALPRFCHVF